MELKYKTNPHSVTKAQVLLIAPLMELKYT